jgi:hypothetical protein
MRFAFLCLPIFINKSPIRLCTIPGRRLRRRATRSDLSASSVCPSLNWQSVIRRVTDGGRLFRRPGARAAKTGARGWPRSPWPSRQRGHRFRSDCSRNTRRWFSACPAILDAVRRQRRMSQCGTLGKAPRGNLQTWTCLSGRAVWTRGAQKSLCRSWSSLPAWGKIRVTRPPDLKTGFLKNPAYQMPVLVQQHNQKTIDVAWTGPRGKPASL